MKIAMVFDGLQVGGIERVGVDYAKLMNQLGHEVTVFNLVPSLIDMEKELSESCKIIHINFPRKMAPELYSKFIKRNFIFKCLYPIAYGIMIIVDIIYKFILHIKNEFKEKYDIVIAFSGHYNDLTFVALNFLKASKKMCWLHGAIYGYALISDGFLNLYNNIKNLIVLVDIFQEEILISNKQLSLNIKKIYNPSFIADKVINDNKVKMLKEKYGSFLMMIGRISKDKDHFTLIKAVEYIRNKYKFNEKLILVGDGEKRAELEEYVKTYDLENAVFFEGTRDDVQNYYKAAYLFVHSSPLEGLPTTLIESLYFSLPIVATDSLPGVREIIGNNTYGIITPVGDYKMMGEAIYKMYQDKEFYENYKRKSIEKFKEFSPETIKEQLKSVLAE